MNILETYLRYNRRKVAGIISISAIAGMALGILLKEKFEKCIKGREDFNGNKII